MSRFILASSNPHKAKEFNQLFDAKIIEVQSAKASLDVEENGTTFIENAFKKAKAYYDHYKVPVLADDSGLCVSALPDDLGVQTARFGGEGLSANQRCELLLKKLNDLNIIDRSAYFVCYLCFYSNPDEIFYFEGRVFGSIGDSLRGDHGFGYDPIFIPRDLKEDKSLAEVPEWKDKFSHRALACQMAQKFFRERVGQKA